MMFQVVERKEREITVKGKAFITICKGGLQFIHTNPRSFTRLIESRVLFNDGSIEYYTTVITNNMYIDLMGKVDSVQEKSKSTVITYQTL